MGDGGQSGWFGNICAGAGGTVQRETAAGHQLFPVHHHYRSTGTKWLRTVLLPTFTVLATPSSTRSLLPVEMISVAGAMVEKEHRCPVDLGTGEENPSEYAVVHPVVTQASFGV